MGFKNLKYFLQDQLYNNIHILFTSIKCLIYTMFMSILSIYKYLVYNIHIVVNLLLTNQTKKPQTNPISKKWWVTDVVSQ